MSGGPALAAAPAAAECAAASCSAALDAAAVALHTAMIRALTAARTHTHVFKIYSLMLLCTSH